MNPTITTPHSSRSGLRRAAFALMVSLAFGIAASSHPKLANAAADDIPASVPTWLRGVWTREWIQKGKTRTDLLDVHYLQTPTYYADIRLPKDRRFSKTKSFADLTDRELRLLARQNGFTGLTTTSGTVHGARTGRPIEE